MATRTKSINGSRLTHQIRLTTSQAARELGISSRGLVRKMLSCSILPGSDGMFSMRQVFDALNSTGDIERRSKEARWQSRIDEAEYAKIRLEEKRGKLLHMDVVLAHFEDLMATFVSGVRHSSMPKPQQRQLIDQIAQIVCRRPPPSGSRLSDSVIEREERRREAERRRQRPVASANGQTE